jgi:translation initiation factor IF-3
LLIPTEGAILTPARDLSGAAAGGGRPPTPSEEAEPIAKPQSFTRINEAIRVPQVRLIGADGSQVGVVDTTRALEMASAAELDLVEVAPEARPPVCRIMDYGKYRYDKEKKAKEARKKQHQVQMKGIRISTANISEHDLEYRLGHIREFIGKGNRVKVSVRFRGRQMAYQDRGREILDEVAKNLVDVAVVDQTPRMEGREMSLILRPV